MYACTACNVGMLYHEDTCSLTCLIILSNLSLDFRYFLFLVDISVKSADTAASKNLGSSVYLFYSLFVCHCACLLHEEEIVFCCLSDCFDQMINNSLQMIMALLFKVRMELSKLPCQCCMFAVLAYSSPYRLMRSKQCNTCS